jgi:myo-inositol 2-dehydrogenase/D-chiro-inositol 1-dehydrogenase
MSTASRRDFLKSSALYAGLASISIVRPKQVRGSQANSRVKLGVVGLGGRGRWIAGLFAKHPGYEIYAAADYFQRVANAAGDQLGVDRSRCFSGLSGYKKLMASGIDAVALETPPYFFPEHARAAVEAGLHVYMAKPVAVDAPGTLEIGELGKKSTDAKRCFLVDFQIPTHPSNIEAVKRVHEGTIGRVVQINTCYWSNGFSDPPKTDTPESRLQRLIWVNDVDLGGSYHVNACIHAVDGGLWIAGGRPTAATGMSSVGRAEPHGDSCDTYSISFEFADGTVMNHTGSHISYPFHVRCVAIGRNGTAEIGYTGNALVRGGSSPYEGGEIGGLYAVGAMRNIMTFHKNIIGEEFANPTVDPSVNSTLATILAREAARRRVRMSMKELIEEGRRIEIDLSGLKA